MTTIVQKWGNSHGIRIPKILLDELQWRDNDEISITTQDNRLIIEKATPKQDKKPTIMELFDGYNDNYQPNEIDWGEPVGGEIW